MTKDYPKKIFPDKRGKYFLLLVSLQHAPSPDAPSHVLVNRNQASYATNVD